MTSNPLYQEIAERYVDVYNRFDISGMMADMHPDVEFENIANGEITHYVRGIDKLKALAELAVTFFSSRREIIRKSYGQDDRLTIEVEYTATLAKDLFGKKAGDTLELNGRSVFTFRDDRIIKLQDFS